MRSFLLILASCALGIAPLARANEETSTHQNPTSAPIEIETRFVAISPNIANAYRQFGCGVKRFLPVAPAADSLFSTASVESGGTDPIKLISSSIVVAEQLPIYIQTLPRQKISELIKLCQSDRQSNIMFAPEEIVSDGDTAEILDIRKRPFVVDIVDEATVIREYNEGTTLLVRPTVQSSGSIQLDLNVHFDQIEDVAVLKRDDKKQIQSPRLKSTKIELSAMLKPGETVVIWGGESTTPEVSTPTSGVAKIIRRKPSAQPRNTSLVLLVTPIIRTREVASTPGR